MQNAVNQLYGAVTNQFAGDGGFDNFVALPPATSAAPAIKEKAGSGSAHEAVAAPAQKPIPAPTPAATVAASTAPETHHSHPIRDMLGKVKDTLTGHGQSSSGDGTRGLDLEAEIGKPDTSKSPLLLPHLPISYKTL